MAKQLKMKTMLFGVILLLGSLIAVDLMPSKSGSGKLRLTVNSEEFKVDRATDKSHE